jgi:hypothetical protein
MQRHRCYFRPSDKRCSLISSGSGEVNAYFILVSVDYEKEEKNSISLWRFKTYLIYSGLYAIIVETTNAIPDTPHSNV